MSERQDQNFRAAEIPRKRTAAELRSWISERWQRMDANRLVDQKGPRWMFWPPEQIRTAERARNFLFWIPTKRDIVKILEMAVRSHGDDRSPIRILDIGGAGGFADKLLVDAAREKGLDVQCVILDPADDVVTEAGRYYAGENETRLTFLSGTLKDHPQLMKQKFDMVFNSYMWSDLKPDIVRINAPARVYVLDRSGSTGGEDSYDPSEGFKNFGSWVVLDHSSVRQQQTSGHLVTSSWSPSSVLVQLSGELARSHGDAIEMRLRELDAVPIQRIGQYQWERDIVKERDAFLADNFVSPSFGKKEAREFLVRRRREREAALRERNLIWWKFRRGEDWMDYPKPEEAS